MKNEVDATIIINTIRTLSMDAIQKANSGHPGAAMALAPLAYAIFDKFLRFNPKNPDWPNRDRFVLSAGHASMLLYSILHVMGCELSLDDIKDFRQLHGVCAGHPEYGLAPGVETTTGPLGQGAGNSVGMAMAEKWLGGYFNRPQFPIIGYNIFAVLGDGDIMEGVCAEAASLAGHLGLDNLIWIYDNNHITIDGGTELVFSEDVGKRFEAYNWYVQHLNDANDIKALESAISSALKEEAKPSLIILDSHIAYGSPNKQDTSAAHGAPLGEDEVRATKEFYGWDPGAKFYLPAEINDYRDRITDRGEKQQQEWDELFEKYLNEYPELALEFRMMQEGRIPEGWDRDISTFAADAKGIASRAANGKILNAIAPHIPWLTGGSADLAESNKTDLKCSGSFAKGNYSQRNIHFGVREHAMGAISNGLALSKLRPYAGTFLIFSDYMKPSVRLASLMKIPVIYIFTHDSIGLGEDGPTHQPIEQLAGLRAIPNLEVIRPADANELALLWRYVAPLNDRPAAFVLSRQAIPTIDRNRYASAEGALRGAYILAGEGDKPDVILIGTGSEVQVCLEAHEQLVKDGIKSRVVSMPCWTIFDNQPQIYRDTVLPPDVTARVAVEAGASLGWERYVGNGKKSRVIGIDRFGASAPSKDLFKEYGFTAENAIRIVKDILFYA